MSKEEKSKKAKEEIQARIRAEAEALAKLYKPEETKHEGGP